MTNNIRMNYIFTLCFLVFSMTLIAQTNQSKGVAVKGYDVVTYFSDKSVKGKMEFSVKYQGIIYRFSTSKNKEVFKKAPAKYIPQYGGWCAYAMGTSGDKVDINPETFEIRNGKLYLFYNKYFTNTFDAWLEENPLKLIPVANKNWLKYEKQP